MKVVVREPFRVCHDGKVWRQGETADVPNALAEEWLRSGWVEEHAGRKAPAKAAGRAAGNAEG